MPWTFAHPAAVLPLLPLAGSGRLSFAALVVGSMSPDFGYYIGSFELASFAHTPLGVLVVCLPAGLLILSLILWLREPIAQLLPQPHRHALLAACHLQAPLSLRSLSLIAISLLLGATTHVLWDAFTHEGRFFVQHIEVLRVPLFTALHREFRVFNLVQHASTVVGIAFLVVAYYRYARRFGTFNALTTADRRCYVVLALIALVAIVCAVPLALNDAKDTGAQTNVSKFVVYEVIYATTAFFTLLSCAALWRRKRRDA